MNDAENNAENNAEMLVTYLRWAKHNTAASRKVEMVASSLLRGKTYDAWRAGWNAALTYFDAA